MRIIFALVAGAAAMALLDVVLTGGDTVNAIAELIRQSLR
jgi:hypothetical protein